MNDVKPLHVFQDGQVYWPTDEIARDLFLELGRISKEMILTDKQARLYELLTERFICQLSVRAIEKSEKSQ